MTFSTLSLSLQSAHARPVRYHSARPWPSLCALTSAGCPRALKEDHPASHDTAKYVPWRIGSVWTETVDVQEYADFLWNLLRRVTRRHGAAWNAVDPRGKPFAATFKPPVATFKPPKRGRKKLSKAQCALHARDGREFNTHEDCEEYRSMLKF